VDSLLEEILEVLIRIGPIVVFVVTMTETALFIGLLVPAEATVLCAAFLADLGYFELEHVLAATLLGGFAGDQIGYALGRFAGRGVAARGGRLGRLWAQHEPRAIALFARRTIVSVSLARFISFVRTLMPWFAGMSGMSWSRFLLYDALGILGWGIGSVALGYAAGRSWEAVAGTLGAVSATIIGALFLIIGLAVWRRSRRRATERA
jgi:membrane protein DedA with SNARE-associated domain